MTEEVISSLLEKHQTSTDKIAKAAQLETLLASLAASIEATGAHYARMITTAGPTGLRMCTNTDSQYFPEFTQANC